MIVNGRTTTAVFSSPFTPIGVGSAQLVGVGDNGELAGAAGVGAAVIAVGILANLALLGGCVYIGYRAGKASCS